MKKVIEKLIESGLTQMELAKIAGCSQPTISEIASGKTKSPSVRIAVALIGECKKRKIKCALEDLT